MSSPGLEFESNNKPVVYASQYGHASYPTAGTFIHSQEKVFAGARNDTSKSAYQLDTGARYWIVGADYLGGLGIVEQPWLNFAREWGPKKPLNLELYLEEMERILPGILKKLFEQFVRSLPPELLGEEGPAGPKWKDNWSGDERV